MSDAGTQPRSPGPTIQKTPKRTPTNRAKGAVRAKSGCYTCRIRRKKCDEKPNEQGFCETCVRLRLECLGFGPKRPDWMRENNNVPEMRERIKSFLAKQGMIKGHSGSGPRSSDGEPPVLRLSEFSSSRGAISPPNRTISTPSSDGEQYTTGLATSNVRQANQTYSPFPSQGAGGGSAVDRSVLYPPQTPQFHMNSDAPLAPPPSALNVPLYSGQGPLSHNVEPNNSSSWGSTALVRQPWTAVYQSRVGESFEDDRSQSPLPSLSGPNISDHDILREHYKKNVVNIQYILADRRVFQHIWEMGEMDPAVNAAMCHLASVHRTKTVHSIQGRYNDGQNSLDHIHGLISHRQINGSFNPNDAMASLHTISSFLFSGGRGSWPRFLEIACEYVQSSLNKARDYQHFLSTCTLAERFIIRTTMWFEVLASVTLRVAPRFLIFYRVAFGHPSAFIEDEDGTSMLSVMGCENQVLLAIAETSALAQWKDQQLANGRLSIPELVRRATHILDILDRLEDLRVGYAYQALHRLRIQTALIFRAAAKLYIHNVVNGDQPSSPEIKVCVDETVQALHSVDHGNSRSVVRSVVFPICIAGCLTDDKRQQYFLSEKLKEQGRESIGNCSEVLKVMERVWDSRKRRQPINWQEAINVPNEPLLLV